MPWRYTTPVTIQALEPAPRQVNAARLSRVVIDWPLNNDGAVRIDVTVNIGARAPNGTFTVLSQASGSLSGAAARAVLDGGLGGRLDEHLLTWMASNGLLPPGSVV